jgi:DNA polymerase-3 subunit beta
VTLTETSAAVPAVEGTIDPEHAWKPRIGAMAAVAGQSSLVADGYTYTIPTMSVDDFPALPVNTELSAFAEVDRDALVTAVTRAKVAAGKDDTLPMLTGILFTNETGSGGIDLVATDRFRLNVAPIGAASEGIVKALVPAAAIAKLVKHLPAGPVGLEFDGGVMYLTAGSVKASVRLLDNEFVKYARLIPTEMSTTMLVNRKALVTAVERVAVVVDKGHHVRLTVSPAGVVVSAGGSEDGSATSPMIAGVVDGTELLIAGNPGYLLDALKGDTAELVAVGFNGPNRPILFADSVDALTDPASFRQLVMPARIPA